MNNAPSISDHLWKRIEGWESYYVHPEGYVKSLKISYNSRRREKVTKERILSMFTVKGYLAVNLVEGNKRQSVRVHRLVAKTFIPKEKGKEQVNHIDGDKKNANVNNLEWCTPSENEYHSYASLGKVSAATKLSPRDKTRIKALYEKGMTQISIAEDYEVNKQTIWKIINGKY